jgi:lysylphosphatidylglycerol synthetase-like protein (DUF2156 family)
MMEETNFVLLWKEHYEKIDQSLAINQQLLKETISRKAESALQSLTRLKKRGIIAAVIYLIVLGILLFYAIANYSSAANYFIVSIGAIFLITAKALYDYIKHLVWVNNIDYNGSITSIQGKLTALQLSILRHNRLMVLQFPFWTTFYLSNTWFPGSVSWVYIVFQLLLTGSFTLLAYWLYKNQTPEHTNKRLVKAFIESSGGKSVNKAIKFYQEIETFKRDN